MDLDQTSDGGYIILVLGDDYYGDFTTLLKKDENGNNEWNMSFYNCTGFSVKQTDNDGYIIGGLDDQIDAFIMKIDKQGIFEWNKSFPRVPADSLIWINGCIQQTQDGGYFFTADFGRTYHAIKMNRSGVVEWVKVYPIPAYIFYGQQTKDGGYILTGTTDYPGCGDTWIVRLDSMGNDIWNKTYVVETYDQGTSGGWYISETQDEGYILRIWYKDTPWSYHNYLSYSIIMRLDHLGNILWSNSSMMGIPKETDDQGYITWYGDQIIKLNKNLEQEWNISLDKIGEFYYMILIQQTFDKGFIATGMKVNHDGFLLKIEPEDHTPPKIEIIYPQKGLYLFNKKLFDLPRNTIVFGSIDIQIEAVDNSSGIDYVEVSVGEFPNATIYNLTEEPYSFNWNHTAFGHFPIMAVAYDNAGNFAFDEIEIWKFF